MIKRSITGILFVIVLAGAVMLSAWSFLILLFIIICLGLWEFYTLVEKTGHEPQKIIGLLLGLSLYKAFVLHSYAAYNHLAIIPLAALLPLCFGLFIIELYRKKTNPFGNIAFTLLGVIYVALPFSLLAMIGFDSTTNYTPNKIMGILLVLWSSDTGAYLSGRAFGKHKLFERISPQKTWEGAVGGGVLAIIAAYIVSIYFTELTVVNWLVIAVIIIVAGNLGDLIESLFKRSVNVKDSGAILPGHGGVLDRFDSLLLSSPFIFIYLFITHRL